MLSALLLLVLAGPPGSSGPVLPPASSTTTVVPFRTEAAPRVDPVFGDVAALRATIDRFLTLQAEMDRVRDEFSVAVHETLAALAAAGAIPAGAPRLCPPSTGASYARALASGGRYLALGQQLQSSYREIRRGDDLGDALGLTPDYKWKVKKAKDLHQQLLSDYREMRVAFYDQLGAEMRHAGCKLGAHGVAAAPSINPTDPGSWEIDEPADEPAQERAQDRAQERTDERERARATDGGAGKAVLPGASASTAPETRAASNAAPAIWIEIDNSLCTQPTRLSIDGQPLGEIGERKKISVRTRSGPREICALPASDTRSCGDTGTLRKAYLHEGWTLTIHCEQ